MPSYNDLVKQIESLTQQAEELRKQEIAAVIAEIKQKMHQYGLSMSDITDGRGAIRSVKKSMSKGAKVAAKYRNPASGETWSGRGRTPKWLAEAESAGKSRDSFAV